ncbi:hypothetical protein AMJ82_11080 [candidate division TA06 bacterium SM23_40]|uniref:Fibronectin type-III domain-containing protein n=2 Tax=Bacteria division TA06 TaxID=1156500 RepID=A0A0S8G2Z3_UNCT6|nr:MAG: hypothetical protein AMJ82_11080 [candidate division TA06 bacterium SM23_40]
MTIAWARGRTPVRGTILHLAAVLVVGAALPLVLAAGILDAQAQEAPALRIDDQVPAIRFDGVIAGDPESGVEAPLQSEARVWEQYVGRTLPAVLMPLGDADRAVGVMDKGQLTNVTSNFGLLSNFHYFAPAMHWPLSASDVEQYCFGLGLLVATEDNVIESFTSQAGAEGDWSPVDGALGMYHSGIDTVADGTPLMATSDRPLSWPLANGERYWPGPFRIDPSTGLEVEGEFSADRDLFCVYNDADNALGPLGFEVRQLAYSYGRSYAEDFLFFDFTIIRTEGTALEDLYIGYFADFRVDFDFLDYLGGFDTTIDGDTLPDFFYYWDVGGTPDPPWTSVGVIGLGVLATPEDRGITDFHYFDHSSPHTTDEAIWPIFSSDTTDPDIDPSQYFHGGNVRFDDLSLLPDIFPGGRAIDFFLSTGPCTLAVGDTVRSAIVVVAGQDTADLFANLAMAQQMFENAYQGPGPPPSPDLHAVAGDGSVTLYWDSSPEMSRDQQSGEYDFEGYKLYRSGDRGTSWGDPVTDAEGNLIGYVPIAQFDLVDGIFGVDPVVNQWLGDETGLRHTFIDSDVINGVEYWYSVTSYDQGDPETSLQSFESSRGRSEQELNTVAVVPGARASNYIEGAASDPELFGGECDSWFDVEVIDPEALTGHKYEVTFIDTGTVVLLDTLGLPDTLRATTLTLVDMTSDDTLLANQALTDSTGDNIPVTHGFRLVAVDAAAAVANLEWTHVEGTQSTFDWFVEDREPGQMVAPAYVDGARDFRITIDTDSVGGGGTLARIDGVFYYTSIPWDTMHIWLPVAGEMLLEDGTPVPVDEMWLLDYRYGWDHVWFGPAGWDLTPGGAGYNPDPTFGDWFPDELGLYSYTVNGDGDTVDVQAVHVRTQNGPVTAIPPSDGDQFTAQVRKLFRSDVSYQFRTTAGRSVAGAGELDRIRVVPNPYVVAARYEASNLEHRIKFNHLPDECDIHIYTVSGDEVKRIHHRSRDGYMFWDLRSEHGLDIAYGLYVYVIETPDGRTKVGKFAIIR